jgi:hypothetical protein
MACAGVIASAGAQLDFTVMTVGTRNVTVGKNTYAYYGFDSSSSTGSLSNSTIEFADGTAYSCIRIENQQTTIRLTMGATVTDSDAASFKRIVIDDLSLNRSDRASFNSNVDWVWNTSDDAISSKNGSTIIVQWRAD